MESLSFLKHNIHAISYTDSNYDIRLCKTHIRMTSYIIYFFMDALYHKHTYSIVTSTLILFSKDQFWIFGTKGKWKKKQWQTGLTPLSRKCCSTIRIKPVTDLPCGPIPITTFKVNHPPPQVVPLHGVGGVCSRTGLRSKVVNLEMDGGDMPLPILRE